MKPGLLFLALTAGLLLPQATQGETLNRQALRDLLTNHVIRADRDGLAVPTRSDGEKHFDSTNAFRLYVDQIFDRAETWSATHFPAAADGRPVVRILIHVHGGLNDWQDTKDRMPLVKLMMRGTNLADAYYPIFVVWPSGFGSSYWEHLTRIRQGNRVSRLYNAASAPVILGTDLAKSAVNLPVAWTRSLASAKDRALYLRNPSSRSLSRVFKMSQHNAARACALGYTVESGTVQDPSGIAWSKFSVGLATTPLRATLGTLGQGAVTESGWQIMKRRTGNLFFPPDLFEWKNDRRNERSFPRPGYSDITNRCGAGEFFHFLTNRVQTGARRFDYRITFVGHSMGTIVLNNLFHAHGADLVRSGCLENIIYMGAACSVKEAANALEPMLLASERATTNQSPTVRFYNLTLHPLAEIAEDMAPLVVPSGSLLYLIDNHLETPNTPLDRTLGWEVNAMSALEVFREVKRLCVFKSFDFERKRLPETHGDFSLSPFWTREFREPRPPHDPVSGPPKPGTYERDWQKTYGIKP